MIDISTEGILFWEEVEKHRLKKLVTCDWEVLPMTGHQFFIAHVTQGQPLGRAAPLIACERGARVLKVQKDHSFFIFRG